MAGKKPGDWIEIGGMFGMDRRADSRAKANASGFRDKTGPLDFCILH